MWSASRSGYKSCPIRSKQLRIRNESEKLVNCTVSRQKCSIKKYNSFLSKKYSPKKLISRHNEQPNTPARQEYKGKIYVKNIRQKSCRIRNRIRIRNQLKSRIRIRKKSFRINNTGIKANLELVFIITGKRIQSSQSSSCNRKGSSILIY